MDVFRQQVSSPIGNLMIEATDFFLVSIVRIQGKTQDDCSPNHLTEITRIQLEEYFNRVRKQFDIPLGFLNATDFQKEVWSKLYETEYGKVYSYKELAIQCGDVKKIRAVGRANGANPIPIIVPCHRIIGSDGSLVGYSGGLDMKKFLLELEQAPIQMSLF